MTTLFDTQFTSFLTAVNNCLNPPLADHAFIDLMKTCAMKTWGGLTVQSGGSTPPPASGKKSGQNAYHMYVKEQKKATPSLDLKEIGANWKLLSDEQKVPYKALAAQANAEKSGTPVGKAPGPKKSAQNGYHMYIKEQKKISSAMDLKEIGAGWKKLTDEQRAAYKVQADAFNAVANGTVVAPVASS